MNKYPFWIFALFFLSIGCSQKELLPEGKRTSIDSLMRLANITGLQLHYFEGDRSADHQFGYRNLKDSSAITPQTIFQAASLSKQATALLALRLVDAGKLNLQQLVAEIYAEPRLQNEPMATQITVAHLLSHSSGLPNWGGDELQLDFEPGTRWQYSGEGYVLLAKVMEKVTGSAFNDLVKTWVFDPLGMGSTSFVWESAFSSDAAIGHNMIQQPGELVQPTEPNAAASLLTTAMDYAKLMRGSMDRQFLSAESQAFFAEEYIEASAWGADELNNYISWGLGVGIQKAENGNALWQWGDNYLFKGMMIYFPESDKGLVYLTNSENGLSTAGALYSQFFDGPQYAVDWMGYETYDNPERSAAIDLEMAYVYKGSKEAVNVYERILRQDSALLTDNLINNTVWSLFGAKRLSEATELIDTHLRNFPNSAEALVRKGEALGFEHNYTASWQAYQQAMEIDPSTSRVIMPRFPWYQEAWSALQAQGAALDLESYVGQYGDVTIARRDEQLIYSDDERVDIPLFRLSNSVFDLENLETFRLRFDLKGDGTQGLTKSHLTGDEEYLPKAGASSI